MDIDEIVLVCVALIVIAIFSWSIFMAFQKTDTSENLSEVSEEKQPLKKQPLIKAKLTPIKNLRREQMALIRLSKELEITAQDIDIKKREAGLLYKELSIERLAIQHEKKELITQEQQQLYDIKRALDTVKDAKKDLSFDQREKNLKLYNREVKHYAQTVQDSYKAQIKDLEQKKTETLQQLEREKAQIKEVFENNKHTVKTLELVSRKNSLDAQGNRQSLDLREINRKASIIHTIEDDWYNRDDITSIQAYNQQGYKLTSPLISENNHLKNEIASLTRRLESGGE